MGETNFGFERVAEREKAARVRGVFDQVAERYDLMNDLMSLGLHRAWKAFTVWLARVRPGERVLDIASGTGDLARALRARGAEVWMSDVNGRMLERGRDRLLDAGGLAPAVQCDAERLPFAAGTFDCVTVAFGLRNMTHKDAALAEMARVLKPGGQLLFIEHVRSEEPNVAKWQDRLNGINRIVAHGCNCNRSTLDVIKQAGFTIGSLEKGQLAKAPAFVRPLITGAAIKTA